VSFKELVVELETKLKETLPGILRPAEPATVEQIRVAESLYGAGLTEDLITLAELHNGCGGGYPMFQSHKRLPAELDELQADLPWPLHGGPFDADSTALSIFSNHLVSYLAVPLQGEYRGHVFRMNTEGHEFSCHVAPSLSELYQSWIYYLDNDYLTILTNLQFVPAGSELHIAGGSDPFELLLEAWPDANPLCMATVHYESSEAAREFVRQRQGGFDPAIDPEHPDFLAWFESFNPPAEGGN